MDAHYIIYLADDDRFLLNMYVMKFQHAGHTVKSFNSGRELIEALREGPTLDALLLDLLMPEFDGYHVLKTIREEGLIPQAKIIVLSNQEQTSDINKAKQFDIDGYIVKASAIPSEVLEKAVNIIEQLSV